MMEALSAAAVAPQAIAAVQAVKRLMSQAVVTTVVQAAPQSTAKQQHTSRQAAGCSRSPSAVAVWLAATALSATITDDLRSRW